MNRALSLCCWLTSLLALACGPSNMLGKHVSLGHYEYAFKGETLQSVEGAAFDDPIPTPTDGSKPKPVLDKTHPVVVFVESDGSACESSGDGGWDDFVTQYTGHYVLVRPRTLANALCDRAEFAKLRFLQRVDELDLVVKDARARHPNQPVILVGYGRGASIAVLYHIKNADKVAGIVNLGGGLDPFERVLIEIEREKGLDSKALQARRKELDAIFAKLRKNPESSAPMWERTEAFWNELIFLETKELWLESKIPVLVVHGTEDKAGVPFNLMGRLKREFKRANKDNVEFRFLTGEDDDLESTHVFLLIDEWVKQKFPAKGQ